MNKFLLLFLFLPLLCRAETLNLKWNNPHHQSFWLTYKADDSTVVFSRNIGTVERYSLELKNGSYEIFVSSKDGQSNVIHYEGKKKQIKDRKPPEIKLEIE